MLLQAPASVPLTHASRVNPVVKSNALLAGISTKPGLLPLMSHAPNGCAASGAARARQTRTTERRKRIMKPSLVPSSKSGEVDGDVVNSLHRRQRVAGVECQACTRRALHR